MFKNVRSDGIEPSQVPYFPTRLLVIVEQIVSSHSCAANVLASGETLNPVNVTTDTLKRRILIHPERDVWTDVITTCEFFVRDSFNVRNPGYRYAVCNVTFFHVNHQRSELL